TLRRHIASIHKGSYHKWCKTEDFLSMLPEDTHARKLDNDKKMQQTQVIDHFDVAEPRKIPVFYSDELFKEAAIEWLIATDQPIQAFEHPKFKNMIDVAASATNSVTLPNRKQAREVIVELFKDQMRRLKDRLNVRGFDFSPADCGIY
ncbi:hypothetical protein BD779DRAFT_1444683, partial [Infundibulicybe gibba]